MSAPVTVTRENNVVHVCLNRPDRLNAFSGELVDALIATLTEAGRQDTQLVVFTGAGKGFSGGFDLSDLDSSSDGDLLLRFVHAEQLLQQIYHAPFATLALVHGACYGAAADLVAACQWRVAAPGSRFRMPGLRFGITLGTARLARLVGADTARALLLRDAPFDADEALAKNFIQNISGQDAWPSLIEQGRQDASALSASTYKAMLDRTRVDTRKADMAALVESVAEGSIKARIQDYLKSVKAIKAAKPAN